MTAPPEISLSLAPPSVSVNSAAPTTSPLRETLLQTVNTQRRVSSQRVSARNHLGEARPRQTHDRYLGAIVDRASIGVQL